MEPFQRHPGGAVSGSFDRFTDVKSVSVKSHVVTHTRTRPKGPRTIVT